jgi:hypothetical protein
MTAEKEHHLCAISKKLQPEDGKNKDKNESDELRRTNLMSEPI